MEEQRYEASMESQSVWKRGLIMLLFAIAFGFAQFLLNLISFVQFLWLLFTGASNHFLRDFGASLSIWLGDVVRFMTCVTEDRPFPWREWPPSE